MILTNSAGRKLYNKLRVSDGFILARKVLYPNAVDDSPIIGDDGTIKYLTVDEAIFPSAPVDYDARYYYVFSPEGAEDSWETKANPTYFIAHNITKRAVEEIKARAVDEEANIRAGLFPQVEVTRDLSIAIVAISRGTKGLSLTDTESAAIARLEDRSSVFTKNLDKLNEKLAAIDAGHEPDLTAEYITELPAE